MNVTPLHTLQSGTTTGGTCRRRGCDALRRRTNFVTIERHSKYSEAVNFSKTAEKYAVIPAQAGIQVVHLIDL